MSPLPTPTPPLACPQCGRPLPAGALAGFCPSCLLAQGADTEPGAAAPAAAPSLEEVAALFPQLEILRLLGAGGMGAVYLARQPALDRLVALKVVGGTSERGIDFAERFNREARALARLSHPHIVAVHEFGQAGPLHYFLMEYLDGVNLRQLERCGRLSPREVLQIIPQICDALQYAHDAGVVHRDIKPENVLVDRKGRVKIADFGLAKILGRESGNRQLTREGQVMGTPHYMAPEQVERPLTVDHRADIYSLGVVLYEMLTGDLPIGKFSPPSRKVELDVRLDEVVLRALENDPGRRYQHASEVKSNLEQIASTPAAPGAVAGPSPQPDRFAWWMGFPIWKLEDGQKSIHSKGILRAFAVAFGVFTVGFGFMSMFTGHSALGWVGVVGWPSVVARLILAGAVVGWAVFRVGQAPVTAFSQGDPAVLPAPEGTATVEPRTLSRKAVVGACWAALFFPATAGLFTTHLVGASWWKRLLESSVLPFGLAAVFGTTLLGWRAVQEIRASRGRMTGLKLAVTDGLLFPLLALNCGVTAGALPFVRWLSHQIWAGGTAIPVSSGIITAFASMAGLALDLFIIRWVWQRVQLAPSSPFSAPAGNRWWHQPRWRTADGILLGLFCALILIAVGEQHRWYSPPSIPPEQELARDPATGYFLHPTGFGPEREVEVSELFDFDRGLAGTFPTGNDGTQKVDGIERNPAWSRAHGFDVDVQGSELRLLEMEVVDVFPLDWYTLTAEKALARLARDADALPHLPLPASAWSSTERLGDTYTYIFRTRDGTCGVLQIISVTNQNGKSTARLRYKTVPRAPAE